MMLAIRFDNSSSKRFRIFPTPNYQITSIKIQFYYLTAPGSVYYLNSRKLFSQIGSNDERMVNCVPIYPGTHAMDLEVYKGGEIEMEQIFDLEVLDSSYQPTSDVFDLTMMLKIE